HFYRVKTIQLNGQESYSGIVKVNMASAEGGLTVYPNPVQNGTINLVFKGEAAGSYTAQLVSNKGELLSTTLIKHTGGNAAFAIRAPGSLAAGTYRLNVQGPGKQLTAINVLIAK
ncbi:T9SS type A sorting domain-containing protein, partial [Segetibacter sp. 3557_3]|uniref:T9SS type A sorting domain-containing protein n=1 Tax=Segetibacter sp. 3557_3 TaxID=2547429 RepID=UPI001058F7FC